MLFPFWEKPVNFQALLSGRLHVSDVHLTFSHALGDEMLKTWGWFRKGTNCLGRCFASPPSLLLSHLSFLLLNHLLGSVEDAVPFSPALSLNPSYACSFHFPSSRISAAECIVWIIPTTASCFEVWCLENLGPKRADLIVLHYTVNSIPPPPLSP